MISSISSALSGSAIAASSSLQLGRDLADGTGAIHHLGHGAAAGHLADVLVEIADGDAAIGRDLAFVGQLLAGDHPEQRGLAGAVRADEADLLALVEGGGGFDEEDLVAGLLADVVEADHGVFLGGILRCSVIGHAGRQGKPGRARIPPARRQASCNSSRRDASRPLSAVSLSASSRSALSERQGVTSANVPYSGLAATARQASACDPGCVKSQELVTIPPFPDGGYGWDASLKARTDPS